MLSAESAFNSSLQIPHLTAIPLNFSRLVLLLLVCALASLHAHVRMHNHNAWTIAGRTPVAPWE